MLRLHIFVLATAVLLSRTALAQFEPLGQARQVTHSQNYDPSLSPDGRSMVYISYIGGHEQFFVASLDGRENRQLTTDAADHEDPAWSPDGKLIAFASNRGGKGDYEIYVMRPDGSDVRLVARTRGRATAPNAAPLSASLAHPLPLRLLISVL